MVANSLDLGHHRHGVQARFLVRGAGLQCLLGQPQVTRHKETGSPYVSRDVLAPDFGEWAGCGMTSTWWLTPHLALWNAVR